MAKAKLKTEKTEASPKSFISAIADEQKRLDSSFILDLMQKISGDSPKMWGSSIIGYGHVHLKYDSGRELDWFKIGFSPRKQNFALYGLLNDSVKEDILKKLGKHSTGKGCLYINKVEEIDKAVLKKIIELACKRKS